MTMNSVCCTALLFLSIAGCDHGPAPQGNLASPGEGTQAATETASPGETIPEETTPPAAVAERPAPEASPVVDETAPALAGIRWTVEAPLTWRNPSRPMRNGEYVVGDGTDEAVMTVFHFPGMGGRVEENIARWAGQFTDSAGDPVEPNVETMTVHYLQVTIVDTHGSFSGGMGSAAGSDQRLLGAIVTGPSGPLFFKLIGPSATVAHAEDAFRAMVQSMTAS